MTPPPTRTLGVFSTTCIVIGAIIGVGIFFNPSKVAALVPTPGLAMLAWAIGGALALCGALAFAELGRRRSGEGAQYQVLRDAFGPMTGFLFVFCNATGVQAGSIGIISIICARNLAAAFAPANHALAGTELIVIATLLIVGVTVANLAGVRWGSRLQNVTVVAKVLVLLAIAGLALASATPAARVDAAPSGTLSPVQGVLAAMVPVLFAYGGWQHALWISGEVAGPRRTLPLAILAGTGVVVLVYLAANAAYLALLGHGGVAASQALAADAVGAIWPESGRRIVAGAVAISAFGVLNAQLLSGPRLIAGIAKDGRFFPVFARGNSRAVPAAAIWLLTLGAIALVLVAGDAGIDKLLTGVVLIDTVFFAATGLALFFLPAVSHDDSGEPARPLPMAKLAAILFVIGEIGLLIGATMDPSTRSASYIGVLWIVFAAALYLVRFRRSVDASANASRP